MRKNFEQIYKGKKVFITGHTGFKGSWLVLWLHQLGAIVKGYALAPEHEQCLYNILPNNTHTSIIADIRNKEYLKAEIIHFEPDFIFHLAAQPLVRKSYQLPAETFEVNAIGTANVLEAVIKLTKKCALVLITTDKVYDNVEQHILYKETDRLGGYDPYSASKACTELVINAFRNSFFNTNNFEQHQKALSSARAGNVIGGGDYSEDRIIPDIIKALSAKNEIVVRNPSAVRPWQHVLEPLQGYLILGGMLYNNPQQYSSAFNFGPNENDHLTVNELANLALQTWGGGSIKINKDSSQPHEANLLQLDISKSKALLGWHPKLTAKEAIEWTINWYKAAPQSKLDFTIAQIQNFMAL